MDFMELSMREIKFRAWDKITEEWNYFNLKNAMDISNFYDNFDDYKNICQFTGLHDKNGKEIYEGDIVKQRFYCSFNDYNDIIGIIEYNNNDCCFYAIDYDNQQLYSMSNIGSSCKIIGNIHQNPELIK